MIRLGYKSTRRLLHSSLFTRRLITSSSTSAIFTRRLIPPSATSPLFTRRLCSTSPPCSKIESLNSSKNVIPTPPQPPTPARVLHRHVYAAIPIVLVSTIIAASSYMMMNKSDEKLKPSKFFHEIEQYVDNSSGFSKIMKRMKQTSGAASVLWKSLASVMSEANHEVRSGFELRVAALLADIAAANESRRAAIVEAGGGAVVDWLLETAAGKGDNVATQAEAARALAYLIADQSVCEAVLGRPHAVPHLLRFIFSAHPRRSKKVSDSYFDI